MTWNEKSPRDASRRLRKVALWTFLFLCPMLLLRTSGGAAEDGTGESKDGYVGSQACSSCHQGIYQQFTKTSMGRSMSLVTPSSLKNIPSGSHFNERLNRKFEAFSLDGKLFQSESGVGTDDKESFRDVHQLEWIIGAGVNGFGAITRRDGFLFQAPLSFYSRPMSWEPSPGYEYIDLGFNRPINPGCIFCHSGRAKPEPGTEGKYNSEPFSELAIGCENCHGPGAAHIRTVSSGKSPVEAKCCSGRFPDY